MAISLQAHGLTLALLDSSTLLRMGSSITEGHHAGHRLNFQRPRKLLAILRFEPLDVASHELITSPTVPNILRPRADRLRHKPCRPGHGLAVVFLVDCGNATKLWKGVTDLTMANTVPLTCWLTEHRMNPNDFGRFGNY